MTHRIVYASRASRQIARLSAYIANEASPAIAQKFVAGLVAHCDRFADFPLRGTQRDDLFPGCRIYAYRRRTDIIFTVTRDQVTILAVYHGGQDYETALRRK